MGRTLVIGDIHGAYKCLVEVLEKAGPADRIIFLGDYVDGLPDTPKVIDHIISLGDKVVCLRGNHDQWALDWLTRCRTQRSYKIFPDPVHYKQGGQSTYESYQQLEDKEWKMNLHWDFLENHTIVRFQDEQGRVFVHGGFERGIFEPDQELMWNRSLIQRAYELHHNWLRSGPPQSGQLPLRFSQYPEIYVGHTVTKFLGGQEKVENWLNLWAMDTNCGWGGPLCAMDVDTKECFYSTPARELYPEYKGR